MNGRRQNIVLTSERRQLNKQMSVLNEAGKKLREFWFFLVCNSTLYSNLS